ncbi:UDP-N-acetyl-D-mannosamine dehydrogenase [Marilutibacter chinensis]|uniref:UDP-N-acetyl-D-mannosamine dehydrogenase n=1 Tax=Marilutibacter chinensis TaxID=2912247 RepID=A0ABS9HQV0_9GAMM|nr:UDP-N-acetyl-D-mannosamine dehydrogenase [Lysobacter chinensis]MCF7221319.1 UDP-N-acetyl-D-mannosamine dehydrogenase [Lysobacter chinensis]
MLNTEVSDNPIQSLSVIGLGYIGLPTAAMFASTGLKTIGVDISARAVEAVNGGRAHIEEGNLDELVERCVGSGLLTATMSPVETDAYIIAVPTPVGHDENRSPDVSYVQAAGRSIAPTLRPGCLIILESTSPVGTTGMLSKLLAELRPDLKFPHESGDEADVCIAYCPERIIPGQMLKELVENDRIIGGMSPRCAERAGALYRRFVRGVCHFTTDRTAEMVKLTENSFRDVNIAFANELSMICESLDVDVWKVIEFANRHPRVSILNPGAGVGGHCIAVDPWFIVSSAPETARLIRMARTVNDAKPEHVLAQVDRHCENGAVEKIACLGLTYKPDVDDFRESPALSIAASLSNRYPGKVVCCDPFAEALGKDEAARLGLVFESTESVLQSADMIVVLVPHSAFKAFPAPSGKLILDPVGFWR